MRAGQTLRASDGHEVALFPMEMMYIWQGWGPTAWTHCCSYSLDLTSGPSPITTPVYAPATCVLVAATNLALQWHTVNPVWTPSGLKYLSWTTVHHDTQVHSVGSTVQQGQLMTYTGNNMAGGINHCHIDFGEGQGQGLYPACICPGGQAYAMTNAIVPERAVFINDTRILSDFGLRWQKWSGPQGFNLELKNGLVIRAWR